MIRRTLDPFTKALTLREQSHRRATLVAIAALLLLSTTGVFGHHLPVDTERLLGGVDHIGALCLTAVHLLLAPVHRGIHIAIVIGLFYAAWNRYRAWHILHGSLQLLDVRPAVTGDPYWVAAESVGVDPKILRVVPGLPNPAFTAGFLAPRIYVSESLAEHLAYDELAALIAHEGAHVARRDPLRLSFFRALACVLFWLPALRRLADDLSDEAELAADEVAARGRPLVLASAILSVARWSSNETVPAVSTVAVGFVRDHLLECRVRRLAGEPVPVRTHVTRRSIIGAVAALVVVWTSGAIMAHPLPAHADEMHARHCDHRGRPALAHLFCMGSPFAPAQGECPHTQG